MHHPHDPLSAFAQFAQAPLPRALFGSLVAHALLLTLLPPIFQTTSLPGPTPITLATLAPKNLTGHALNNKPTTRPAGVENIPNRPLLTTSDTKTPTPPHTPALPQVVAAPSPALGTAAADVSSVVPSNNTSNEQKPIAADIDKQTHEESTSTVPAEGLRTYRLALGREARRLKIEYEHKYSHSERELQNGQEGRVEMNVRIHPAGTTVVLKRSSGHRNLDEQALELIERAVHQTQLPDSLLGRHFLMPVALDFEIARE